MKRPPALCVFAFLLCSVSFAKGFDEKVFSPGLGVTGFFMASQTYNNESWYLSDAGVGPSLNLDMRFILKKSGFTFMVNTAASPVFITQYKDPYAPTPRPFGMGFGVLCYTEFLFGYTYGAGSRFEVSAGIGPAILWPIEPGICFKLGLSYYFSRKFGIYCGLGDCLLFGSGPMYGGVDRWRVANLMSFVIGPAFRID